MPTLKVFVGLAVLLALTGAVAATRAQQPAPESCGDASDMAALIDCARKRETNRAARCASSGPAPMSWPAPGDVIVPFGAATKHGTHSKGLVIATPSEAIVKSPVAGVVLFAGAYRSYGQIVIIDACAHDVLLAGLTQIDVPAGGSLGLGQPLGAMAKTSGDAPVLYIEARRDGRPIDPAPLLGQR